MDWIPAYQEPGCNEGRIKWLHNIAKTKSLSINAAMTTEKEEEKGEMVNVAMVCSNRGQRMPVATRFKMESELLLVREEEKKEGNG
jgi:hypothetical protein